MPVEDVVVYCITCTKSIFWMRKNSHYMIDLLFREETVPKIIKPDQWHKEFDEYLMIKIGILKDFK